MIKLLITTLLLLPSSYASHACSALVAGSNFGTANWGGFKPFPSSVIYNNISTAPADPMSATWVGHIGGQLRPQYSPWFWFDDLALPYLGLTWYVVDGSTVRRQNVYIDSPGEAYPIDSDPGVVVVPLPAVLANPRIQATLTGTLGGPTLAFTSGGYAYPPQVLINPYGDKHYYIVDKSNCLSHELWNCYQYGGSMHCGIVTTFDMLDGDHQRPYFKTSGSASGMPFMGMVGFAGEFSSGNSAGHALACSATVDLFQGSPFPSRTGINRKGFTGAASHHQYGNTNDPNLPPLGAILRLKSSFNTSPYTGVGKGILETLKSHGCMLTDGGASVEFYLEMANAWGSNMLSYLDHPVSVNSTNFDFVQVTTPIYSDAVGQFPSYTTPPTISSFTASPGGTVSSGTAVTLSWVVSNATAIRYLYPAIGPVRGPSESGMDASGYDTTGVIVHPTRTTTYTLMVQNGGIHNDGTGWYTANRTTATVCVAVTGSTACP